VTRRTVADVAEDYEVLVRRDPAITNREVAARLGMSHDALTQALARARRRGLLHLWRVGYGHTPQIARRGERNGVPAC